MIAADPLSGGFGAIDPQTLATIRDVPEIASVVGVYGDLGQVNGTIEFLTSFDDPGLAVRTFGMKVVSGTLAPIGAGQAIVDDRSAADPWPFGRQHRHHPYRPRRPGAGDDSRHV